MPLSSFPHAPAPDRFHGTPSCFPCRIFVYGGVEDTVCRECSGVVWFFRAPAPIVAVHWAPLAGTTKYRKPQLSSTGNLANPLTLLSRVHSGWTPHGESHDPVGLSPPWPTVKFSGWQRLHSQRKCIVNKPLRNEKEILRNVRIRRENCKQDRYRLTMIYKLTSISSATRFVSLTLQLRGWVHKSVRGNAKKYNYRYKIMSKWEGE